MTKEEIKNTLNIPHSDFAMTVNPVVSEPAMHEWWIAHDIYNKVQKKHQNNTQKILHDGPPYANGKLHLGHAMNKVLKDMIVRLWSMQGYYSPYVMGWDVHGLPIEHALIKLGINTDPKLTIVQKRDNCFKFAMMNLLIQKEQFKSFGIFTDYNVFYRTCDHYLEFKQLRLFNEMIKDKLAYKSLKPVYWSWSSQSALAEDEIEYHDDQSDSIYVSFLLEGDKYPATSLLIWTTTPWTIPANLAVAVNPKFDYDWIEVNGAKYIVLGSRIEALKKALNWTDVKILKENIKGTELDGLKYHHPLYPDSILPVIEADYVSAEDGTGLVHNAPAFGLDDYNACKKYGIGPEYCPIDNNGKFDKTVKSPELVGMFYKDANPLVIQRLKDSGHLLSATTFTHSVAFDWRTKKPVIYRATTQWFVDIDKIRQQLVDVINAKGEHAINFPNGEWAQKNLTYMAAHRGEWCVSRQRYWGVPIVIVYDENNNPVFDFDLNNHMIDLIEKAGNCNIWFTEPVEYFLTDKYKNDGHKYRKETDIMDVWFDSGASHDMFEHFGWNYPCELYIEGVDQFRGWFNSSTITGVVLHNLAPFHTLISHGFILDEKGEKMSKSLGNGIDPEVIAKKYGTDIFRLWVASASWMGDIAIGENIMKQVAEYYRKIRNTLFKYSISNLYDFDPSKDMQKELALADKFIINTVHDELSKIVDWNDKYNFVDMVKSTINLVNNLSNWYFDIIKDPLYCDKKDSIRRKQIQTTLYLLLKNYMIALAPFLPHTCEELYQVGKKMFGWQEESIFLYDYITHEQLDKELPDKVDMKLFEQFFKVKDEVYAELETLRNNKTINKNTEAVVVLPESELTKLVPVTTLKTWLNVADVTLGENLSTAKAEGYKPCDRCWLYFKELNQDNLCERCANAIKQ